MCRIIEILRVLQSFIQQKPFPDAPQKEELCQIDRKHMLRSFF